MSLAMWLSGRTAESTYDSVAISAAHVYRECDSNPVYSELDRLLEGRGRVSLRQVLSLGRSEAASTTEELFAQKPMTEPSPSSAFVPLSEGRYLATLLTRGPWDLGHQHAGPPIALVLGAIERVAAQREMMHIARLTANLFRPIPIGQLSIEVGVDYAGRNSAHISASLHAADKEVARFTGLAQRMVNEPVSRGLAGHPWPQAPRSPDNSPPARFPFEHRQLCYFDLVETRVAAGGIFNGPSAVWFRLNHPIVADEVPSVYQRVAVAADSGNGVSAVLDPRHFLFVNSDLTINLLRRPRGEWVCLEARSLLGDEGSGLAESVLYDIGGVIGRATQSLFVRKRKG